MRGDSKNERTMLRTSRSLSRASTRLAVEPADREAVALAQAQQVVDAEREARARRRSRPRAPGRESRCATSPGASGSAGARTAARWCRSARAARGSPPAAAPWRTGTPARAARRPRRRRAAPGARRLDLRVAVEEPARLALEQRGQQLQHLLGGHALAALDHAEVGDRGRRRARRAGCSAPTAPPASGRCACAARAAWCRGSGSCGCAAAHGPVGWAVCEINSVKFP